MRTSDVVISTVLIGISASIFFVTSSYPKPLVSGEPGPALFPRILAGSLIALASLLFVHAVRGKQTTNDGFSWRAVRRPFIALMLMVAFVAVVGYFDTFILLPLLLGAVMVLMGERSITMIFIVTLSFDLFVYVVFYRIFHVMLPTTYF